MGEQQAPWTAIEIDQELCEHLFEALLALSRDEPGISRASYGEGEELAHRLVQDTGTSLGLTPAVDAAGNLYLTLDGADPGLPAWMIGSHLDSVAHGGNFDGAAGVIGGLAAVAALQGAGIRPKRPLTVVAFRAEESTWFPASYIGSRAAFGLLDRENLQVRRVDTGLSLYDHMAALGLDPEMVAQGRSHLDPNRIHGFVEIHIEQGPTLENAGIQIGLVTGISGSFRYRQARCLGSYALSSPSRI
jgi:N-carbamoyl-L-amino-acid hydrolase